MSIDGSPRSWRRRRRFAIVRAVLRRHRPMYSRSVCRTRCGPQTRLSMPAITSLQGVRPWERSACAPRNSRGCGIGIRTAAFTRYRHLPRAVGCPMFLANNHARSACSVPLGNDFRRWARQPHRIRSDQLPVPQALGHLPEWAARQSRESRAMYTATISGRAISDFRPHIGCPKGS